MLPYNGNHPRKKSFANCLCVKTFAIQAISYIKIPAEIKSVRKHSRMLPDSRNFSSADDSRYTVLRHAEDEKVPRTNSFVPVAILQVCNRKHK